MVESCLCGRAMVLFALLKLPNLVKLCSFEMSIYSCTIEACSTSKFFVVEDISFILHGSYMMGELKRHHPILRKSRYRELVKALVSGYRGDERRKAQCSLLPRFLCTGNVKKPSLTGGKTWSREGRIELW